MPSVNIVCVNAGNYLGRGVEYVNNLYKAVKANTTQHFHFICLTDDLSNKRSYHTKIKLQQLPKDLKGWWNKMALFKAGMIPKGRTIYFDLDTVIVGNIDDLLNIRTSFAMLRDFMRPDSSPLGSGVMAWKGPQDLWEKYESAGRPVPEGGDQDFIRENIGKADLLQNLVDGIYSYKVHCRESLPGDARIVCFHGLPRPHQVNEDWVIKNWKVQNG